MSLMAKDTGGGDFTPVPEGTHLAICNMVVDLGLQNTTYMGAETIKHQCYIRWELPNERLEWTDQGGTQREGPMIIGKTYTVSLSEKANLRKDLQAWRGKAFTTKELEGFDLFVLLGVCCQVTVVHAHKDNRTYSNVQSLAGWPKGMEKPGGAENPLLKYSSDDTDDYENLPTWIKEKLSKQLPEDHQVFQPGDPGLSDDDPDDSIPF